MNWCTVRLIAPVIFLTILTGQCRADISLPSIFSDNMVLQRESQTKIYGTADPKQKLSVQLGDMILKTTTGADGNWSVLMPTGKAGGPFELTVTAAEGQPQIKLSNVMVGEVWLCAGESNMSWPVSKVLNASREIEKSVNFPNIRFFSAKENASRLPLPNFQNVSGWSVCSPETTENFSGVGYFFARELSKTLPDIPIGIIMSTHDGTCEAWTSRKGLEAVPRFQAMLEYWDGRDDENHNRPNVLFNAMIAPLKEVQFRGVLWYQGESNHGRGEQYAELFPAMIADWRQFFETPKLPFYFVQLPPYRYEQKPPESLPELWDAQLKTLNHSKHVGMVVTSDIADVKEPHPKNKQEVARRLALLASHNIYPDQPPTDKQLQVCNGPIFQSMRIDGQKIHLLFDNADGLKARNPDEKITGFQIAGADQKFSPVHATIVNDTVELSYPAEITPVAVRFGWTDTFVSPITNAAGFPASSFRTDNFPLLSEGKDF